MSLANKLGESALWLAARINDGSFINVHEDHSFELAQIALLLMEARDAANSSTQTHSEKRESLLAEIHRKNKRDWRSRFARNPRSAVVEGWRSA